MKQKFKQYKTEDTMHDEIVSSGLMVNTVAGTVFHRNIVFTKTEYLRIRIDG